MPVEAKAAPLFAPPVSVPVPFLEIMFSYLWRRRPPVPDSRSLFGASIQSTVLILRQVTGISREDLAGRLLITLLQLNNIESRGRPMRAEYATRLAVVAGDYGLVDLYEFFFNKAAEIRKKSRPNLNTKKFD